MSAYEWQDYRNLLGWAAECVTEALALRPGVTDDNVALIMHWIERVIAGTSEPVVLSGLEVSTLDTTPAQQGAAYLLWAVRQFCTRDLSMARDYGVVRRLVLSAIEYTNRAGLPDEAIDLASYRWLARDLACGHEPTGEILRAAIAAIAASQFELARSILAGRP